MVDDKLKIKDLKDIIAVFEKYGVKIFMCYGGLLGIVRDKKFLPKDDDFDMAVVDKIDFRTRKAIGWTLFDLGFMPQGHREGTGITFNVFGRMEQLELGYNGTEESGIMVLERNFNFTIFFFQEEDCEIHGKEYVCVPKQGAIKVISTPARFFEKASKVKHMGVEMLAPAPIEEYLTCTYGNWKVPEEGKHANKYYEDHLNYKYE